jgi:uncharacterized protein (TIGR03086 family)
MTRSVRRQRVTARGYRSRMDDITLLRRAVDDATRIIDGITPAQLGLPTPCPDFTVGQLVAHLVEGVEMFSAALDPSSASAGDEWKAAGQRVAAAAETPGAADAPIALPYGEFPRIVVIQQALGEIAIHAADLARATGQPLGDDAVYERVFAVVGEEWRVDGVLGPAVPCADDAPLADRVLAFAGRAIG